MRYNIRSGYETNSSSKHAIVRTTKNMGARMTQKEIRAEFWLDEEWSRSKNKDGKEVVELYNKYEGEFGRSPFSVLYTFRDKLLYYLASFCGNNYSIESYIEADKIYDETVLPVITRLIGCYDVIVDTDYKPFYIYADKECKYLDEAEEVPYEKLVYREDRDEDGEIYEEFDADNRPIERVFFDVPDYGAIDHKSIGVLNKFLADNDMSLEEYLTRKDVVVIIDGDETNVFSGLIEAGLVDRKSFISYTGE